MKIKISRNQIKSNYYRVLQCGYCGMQYLLSFHDPIGYNSGMYGWNFNLYDVDGIAITTGYRNMIGTCINPAALEKEAETIYNDRSLSYETKKEMIENLLHKAINKVGENE